MLILAIESSCDEFSLALVENGNTCLFMETLSQIDIHANYGGVIPELASREHTKYFSIVLEKLDNFLNSNWREVDAIAVTIGPGLSGSLLVGIQVAKVIATMLNKPLIPVHHILGHVLSPNLSAELQFPYLALVVSGGHTELVYCRDVNTFETIGATRDDAVGEVYDKVAKKLGLAYPGGPIIDQLAQQGERTFSFPKPKMADPLAFSFSGLKSAVINVINNATNRREQIVIEDVATSFQAVVVEELVDKVERAIAMYEVKMVGLCGGVSANRSLRTAFLELASKHDQKLFVIPELKYCGDNAAMIGVAAYHLSRITNRTQKTKLECYPNISITDFMEFENMRKERDER